MKSLKTFFKGLRSNIDKDKIENYYGHGTHKHDHSGHSHNSDNESKPDIKYTCPMKCEGDKTYDAPGNCPVCNMKLIAVDIYKLF
jgi:hypothetical protein